MAAKRKISIRRILQLFVTVMATTGCIMAILSASTMRSHKQVTGIDIRIRNDQYHFIDKQQVMDQLLNDRHIDLGRLKMNKLNVRQMESILNANPWVADAQVYVDNKQKLHILVTQRVPVARLFEQDGNSYYLDHTLSEMPLSDKYIHYTTVVTNVPVLKEDSTDKALKSQVVTLVKYIDKDSFWSAQISQVIVTDDRKFELVPVLGNHRILFGDTTHLQDKFENLFAFYKKIMNSIGWDKYEVLDVRYENQVVASPALPWKKPADNAMSNMNWVKSIIGNEPKPIESDTPAVMPPATVNMNQAMAKQETKPVATPQQKAAVVQQPVVKPAVAAQQPVKRSTPKKPEVKQTIQASAAIKKQPEKHKTAEEKPKNNKEKTGEPTPKYIYQGN